MIGELKTIDMVINEFIQLFEIIENEMIDNIQPVDPGEEGIELNETN